MYIGGMWEFSVIVLKLFNKFGIVIKLKKYNYHYPYPVKNIF